MAKLKFLQVKENETLADVLLRQHVCVKGKEGNCISLLLNKNHKYYFQLYQQTFVKESHRGILIVKGSNGDMFHEKVKFEEHFWSSILGKLEMFFDSVMMYELAYPQKLY